MIALFTDFGLDGPYVGQMKAVLAARAEGVAVVDLMHDVPPFDSKSGAYLLAALLPYLPANSVVAAVVDPGVGSEREALVLEADSRRIVGPDNGLMEIAARHADDARWRRVAWQPEELSASFHGRDLFAPIAARLATGVLFEGDAAAPDSAFAAWPDDLPEVIYIDRYGNAVTGLRASTIGWAPEVRIGDVELERGRTFSDLPLGQAFWYENANGLIEIAVNQGSAAAVLGLAVGTAVSVT